MSTSLAQLITQQTVSQIFNTLIGVYQANGFPTTAWQPFDIDRTRLSAIATAINSVIAQYVPAIAGGSLLDYAPNYPGWTALTAQQIFNLIQNAATFTQGNLLATNSSSVSYPFTTASPLKFTFTQSTNSYFSTGSGTIPANGTLSIPVIAAASGASYNDPSNSAGIVLTTPLPGVTITNPASTYTSVTQTGSGTGTLTLTGSPSTPHSVLIVITSTGQSGSATWSYSLDGAAPVNAGAVLSITNLGGTGINVALTNGSINPSFVANDTYLFSTPSSWITSQGANTEADTALAIRCRNRWSSLSSVPTQGLYQLLATSTPSVGSQVTQCTVVPDSVINNKINIIVSGPGGVLPSSTITAIQSYITPRARGCDNPVVQSPTTTTVTIAATISATAALLTSVQNSVTTALQNYIAGIQVNGTIRINAIVDAIMNIAGVVDVTPGSVTINGSASNLTLGSIGTYVLPAYPPTLNFSYTGV